jgi:hypothetical protein
MTSLDVRYENAFANLGLPLASAMPRFSPCLCDGLLRL